MRKVYALDTEKSCHCDDPELKVAPQVVTMIILCATNYDIAVVPTGNLSPGYNAEWE